MGPAQIASAITQILYFYQFLPDEWKRKAYFIFEKIWDRGNVVFSTNTEALKTIYEVKFDDKRINTIMEKLPTTDKSIMIQGWAMLNLISRGLHSESDKIKVDIQSRYGRRGINIVNILTTGDIDYLIDDITDLSNKDEVLKVFNWWAENYEKVALLINPDDTKEELKEKIIKISSSLVKDYILIHSTGNFLEIQKNSKILSELFENGIIKYETIDVHIYDSGLCKALKAKVQF
ncbi:hypothetical protein BMS3Bbin16_00507 [archaeon BMS3Bbin16]|nr:hypothetical protein BMS3Bbin16_00507 [archaeon BMS3Bbin16]